MDRQTLISELARCAEVFKRAGGCICCDNRYPLEGGLGQLFTAALLEINGQPELVHCSECVHCEKSEFAGFWFCDAWDEDVSMAYQDPEKYYCAEGVKREL